VTRGIGVAWLAGLMLWLGSPADGQVALEDGPVTRVDHFYAESGAMNELLGLLKERLSLPEAWPDQDHGNFATGAVSLGNVTFEVVRFAGSPPDRAAYGGIALEPTDDTEALIEWLTARGIEHGDPKAVPPAGPAFFETTRLPSLSPGATEVFVCDYKDRSRILARQAAATNALAAAHGGPLGVLGVRELVIESTDLDGARRAWAEVAPGTRLEDGAVVVRFESGPAIRIVAGTTDRFAGVALTVRSLAAAAEFLDEAGLAERVDHGELRIAREAVGGLKVVLGAE